MMLKRMARRAVLFVVFVLTAALVAGMMPLSVSAAGHWAESAVGMLNEEVYPNGNLFKASDEPYTADEAGDFLRYLNYDGTDVNGIPIADIFGSDGSTPITRAEACVLIYAILHQPYTAAADFPDCGNLNPIQKAAIGRLQELGVAGGYPDGNFGPADGCSQGMFAVLLMRTLRETGNMESNFSYFLPGQYGKFETQYLALRTCLPEEADSLRGFLDGGWADAKVIMNSSNQPASASEWFYGKEEIWGAWAGRLDSIASGFGLVESGGGITTEYNSASDDIIEAAVQIVSEDRERLKPEHRGMFSDADPRHWAYNGVMYMANRGIIMGNGEGQAMLTDIAPTGTVDVVASRINGAWLTEEIEWDEGAAAERQYVAYICSLLYNGYNEDAVNLTVLDRFGDADQIDEEYRAAMAYLVSAGVIGGTPDNLILPENHATRAETMVIFQRVLYGLDETKMKDYQDAVEYAITGDWEDGNE